MSGKKSMGVTLTTFDNDREGRIARVFEKVNPIGHGADVAEVVAAL